jgi:AraC family transcriptional regulator of adaptative response / methylphosphotriester-DNA alkyltransferase methyltransferase
VHPETLAAHRRLYLLARVVVARHYRRELTLAEVAGALLTSPRQLQRAYARFGEHTFKEDLFARRMAAAAELLIEQRAIPVQDVARLVGYRQGAQFARAFRRCYGLSPARFREQGRRHKRASQAASAGHELAGHEVEGLVREASSWVGVSSRPRAAHTGE